MASWRPEGWTRFDYDETINNAYEAGADAMLEALRKEGHHINAAKGVIRVEVPNPFRTRFKGAMAFIPDNDKLPFEP